MMKTIRQIIKALKTKDPIIVEWVDASNEEPKPEGLTWVGLKNSIDSLKEVQITTIGFFHCHRGQTLFLFNDHDMDISDPQIANLAQIPIGCVRNILKLERDTFDNSGSNKANNRTNRKKKIRKNE